MRLGGQDAIILVMSYIMLCELPLACCDHSYLVTICVSRFIVFITSTIDQSSDLQYSCIMQLSPCKLYRQACYDT